MSMTQRRCLAFTGDGSALVWEERERLPSNLEPKEITPGMWPGRVSKANVVWVCNTQMWRARPVAIPAEYHLADCSPNADQVLLQSEDPYSGPVVMDAQTGELSPELADGSYCRPRWSPAGSSFALSKGSSSWGIRVCAASDNHTVCSLC